MAPPDGEWRGKGLAIRVTDIYSVLRSRKLEWRCRTETVTQDTSLRVTPPAAGREGRSSGVRSRERGSVDIWGRKPRRKGRWLGAFLCATAVALIGPVPASGACPNDAFRHGPAAGLPNCRAYEMVSPPDKNGGEVMPEVQRTRAASGESAELPMAVSFTSLTGFGDVHGTTIATEYLAQRTAQPGTNGWATHGITPAQQPGDFVATVIGGDNDPLFVGDFSDDLTHGAFQSWSPLTDAPNVTEVPNLYTRNDLRTLGPESWTLLTDAFAPLQRSLAKPWFDGASVDFSHVIFESQQTLTPEVPACTPSPFAPCPTHLYEAVDGAVRPAGILPDTACASPPCVAASSVAGQGQNEGIDGHHTPHTISDDGRRIIFTDTSTGTGNGDGDLYMRIDGTTTVQLNASEGSDPSGPATYWDASTDGSRVFFTSDAALTSDVSVDGRTHLYMYSAEPDAAGHHLTHIAAGISGVIGASDDGHYLYAMSGLQILVFHEDSGTWQSDNVGVITFDDVRQDASNLNWFFFPKASRVTPDGRHLLFAASDGSGLTGYDQTSACGTGGLFDGLLGCTGLYVYSVQPEGPDHAHLHCATCSPSGTPATSDATDVVRVEVGLSQITDHSPRAISDDGRYVFFSTADPLVPQDVNGKFDVYEYDVADGSVHLLSNGTDTSDSYFLDASANGRDAFFVTRARLVGWDQDTLRDLYDARVDGGVPDPAVGSLPCSGSSCHGSPSAAPTAPAAATETAEGRGNVHVEAQKRRHRLVCRHGRVKRRVHGRVRCVRRRRHPHARRAGRALHARPVSVLSISSERAR